MPKVKFVDLGQQYFSHRSEILNKFDELSLGGQYVLSDELTVFEQNFSHYCGTPYSIGVANGSDALLLSMLALGVGPGDEVITAPNSFIATAWSIARTGATIVFCDVDQSMNLDPEQLPNKITERTKAIIPVHLTGRVADMNAILQIAKLYDLIVLEDAAQAVGASYHGQRAGSFGHAAAFSLHPLKNLHVHGDGGVITTSDKALYEKLLQFRNHGLSDRDTCVFWGMNSRLDSIHAGIANIKLPHLDAMNSRFRQFAKQYSDRLSPYVCVPEHTENELPVYHRYMIRHEQRNALQDYLATVGIETKINYQVPLHLQPAAAELGYSYGDFPVAEQLAQTILSLPLNYEMTSDQIEYVSEHVIRFFSQ